MSPITGLEAVMANLNKEISGIENRSLKGLKKAAALVREDMDKTPPLIPVGTGNLRGSWTIVSAYLSPSSPVVIMGFLANYAAFVHEMVGANFKRPDSGAKFFEASLKRNRDKILDTIAQEAKIK